ncbi:hypothetical protein Ocin01_16405 [Orchesella cincta]|uniref:Uncharacterized protein n=1 Tax=Orchesella cincta TaxID=48709 RepID=A0A1D2MB98_ORCCI|nr:hypothetical protein Ocin01_16405 [Orchesella cincta]
MGKLILGLQLAVIFTVILIVNAKTPYPDWSCYPGLDPTWIDYAMELCEGQECEKSCILKFHGIVHWNNYRTLQSKKSTVNRMNYFLFSKDAHGKSSSRIIARRLHANCSHLSSDANEPKCSPELEKCIENVTVIYFCSFCSVKFKSSLNYIMSISLELLMQGLRWLESV